MAKCSTSKRPKASTTRNARRKPEKTAAARKKVAKRSSRRKSPPKRTDAIKVLDLEAGAVELVYRRGGQAFRHRFGAGVKLLATKDGQALILTGGKFRVRPFLEG